MQHVTCHANLKRDLASEYSESERGKCADSDNNIRMQWFDGTQVETVLEIWRNLEEKLGSTSLMCSADWTQIWLKHYQESLSVRFVVGYRQDQACGICLLSESKHHQIGPFSFRALHLGTAGELHGESVCVEYNEILCDSRDRNEFVNELQKLILQQKNWDQFRLDGIGVSADQSWPLLQKNEPQREQITVNTRVRESRYFDLEHCRTHGGDILSMLGKSTRSNIKRRIKKLGEVELEWAETAGQASDIFSELIDLHQARWEKEGHPGAFASERFTSFQQDLIASVSPLRKVVLCRIKTGQKTVGCLYLLVDGNRLLDYVSGLACFDEFPGAGLISHYLCMNEALKRGYTAYDFLVGDKRHKENLGKSVNQLQWIVCERNRALFRFRNMAQKARRLVKRIARKT